MNAGIVWVTVFVAVFGHESADISLSHGITDIQC